MASIGNYAYILKYKLAVASVRKVDEPLKLAHAVRHLGDAYGYAKQTAEAESCYAEALSIYRSNEHTQPLDLANAIGHYAGLKDSVGAAEEAGDLWQEAHDLYVQVNVQAGVAGSSAHLALLAQRQGNLELSREWLAKAIAAATLSNDTEIQEYVREVKAQITGVNS